MTLALLALAALLVGLLAYRLWNLPKALQAAQSRQALMDAPAPALTGHMVFPPGPLEHNEHGFITTPMVDCSTVDPNCPCCTMRMSLGGLHNG